MSGCRWNMISMGFWSPERGESITDQVATSQGITQLPEPLLAPFLDIHLMCDAHTCAAADTKPPSLLINRYPVPKVSNTFHYMRCFVSAARAITSPYSPPCSQHHHPLLTPCIPSSAFCISICVRVQRMPPRKEAQSTSTNPCALNCVDL